MVNDNKIIKEKIILKLKEKLGFSTTICGEIVDRFFDEIFALVKQDHKLVLPNFGKFSLNNKKPRPGLHFKQKQAMIIPARTVISFTPSKTLKILVNNRENR